MPFVRRFQPTALLLVVLVFVAGCVFPASLALADSGRPPAEATAHALEELANVCAQRRPECPATPTLAPTPTWTPSPTSTSSPTLEPTATSTPAAVATPEPCWLSDQVLGDPDAGYIVFDQDGAPVPCPLDQPLSTEEPTPTAEPRAVSTETPVPVRPAPAAAIVAAQSVAAVPAPAPELPTYTPYPTYTPQPTWTAQATRTAVSTPTVTSTATRTPGPTGTATATPTGTPAPIALAPVKPALEPSGRWSWATFFQVFAGLVLAGALLTWLMTRRRVAVWRPKTKTRSTADA